MLARLIETWAGLPRAAGSHLQERSWFDLKATYASDKRAEMAKDVAAFANAEGGALIIGASEGATEPDYSSPLRAEYATKLEESFDLAIRDFCRPSPNVHVRAIPTPTDASKVVLVVNVEAFVDQPVAARHETDRDMWRFPIRVGRHTEYILPEQLPLYMNSKARRAKLLLLRALDGGGEIDLFMVPAGGMKHSNIQGAVPFKIEAVDANSGGALAIRECGDDGQTATIPLDDVQAVWLEHTGKWAVRVAGRLEHFSSFDGREVNQLGYTPPSTFVVSPLGRVVSDLAGHVKDISKALGRTLVVEQHPRVEPSQEAIAERAHQLWQLREAHNTPGTPENDWLRARAQLLQALRSQ